jgi:hypothetical protein
MLLPSGIRPIMTRTERDGNWHGRWIQPRAQWAQVGVSTVQYGPGVENSFAGVAQAYADASPILFLPLICAGSA